MRAAFKMMAVLAGLLLMPVAAVFGGPPFLTDDPEPTDFRHFETYLYALGDHDKNGYTVDGPAAEINYGAFPDVQLSGTLTTTSAGGKGVPTATGLGDTLLGIKYRFVHETNGWPQIAVYPQLNLPTGNSRLNLGNGSLWFEAPVWVQKSWGPWTTYGGGGELWNWEPGHRDFPFGGWLVQRDLTSRLTLGGELYAQGQDTDDDHGYVALNFGGMYKFTDIFSVVFSAGHSVAGDQETLWYFGLNFDW